MANQFDPLDVEKTVVSFGEKGGYALSGGDVLGQYRILRQLGKGGMGQVYEAEHTTLGRRYALKLLPADFLTSANALERFRREAKVMANLEHPNIIRVDEFGETDGRYWLRMELAEGIRHEAQGNRELCITLADLVKAYGGKIPQDILLPILKQMLGGLEYAHRKGAVHRDLKPSNILLQHGVGSGEQRVSVPQAPGSTPQVKIADFGLVKLVGEEWVKSMVELSVRQSMSMGNEKTFGGDSTGTSTKSLLGTYEYMSPEQKRGEEADTRSDIYSVGLMIFKLLTGEELGMRTPSQLVSGLDPAWDNLVLKALESAPGNRFQSVAEMVRALPGAVPAKRPENVDATPSSRSSLPGKRDEGVASTLAGAGPKEGQKWAAQLGGGVEMEFMPISAGSFQMGSNNGGSDEKPVHQVTLTKPFWLAKTEVTQQQYQQIMGCNPSKFKEGYGWFKKLGSEAWGNPVERVSWNDAVEFCRKLTQLERQAGRLPEGFEYTLPTEAQWEYACRAGTTGDYAGSLDVMGWYSSNGGGKTHSVGSKQANAWGLYDMHGNVWEWCLDWYGDYPSGNVTTDPQGAGSGSDRVLRGGSWYCGASFCRSASRIGCGSSRADNDGGFRACIVRK